MAWKLVLVHVPIVQEICGLLKKPKRPKPDDEIFNNTSGSFSMDFEAAGDLVKLGEFGGRGRLEEERVESPL